MKEYQFNTGFLGKWMQEHPYVTKSEMLKVFKTQDFASLNRWASGDVMPTHQILRFCNHYDVPIENFFIGMGIAVDNGKHRETADAEQEDRPADKPMYDTAVMTSGKRAQLEAHHQKELYLASRKAQNREDEIRAQYESRMDTMRDKYLDIINKQTEQITYLSNILATTTMNGMSSPMMMGMASEPIAKGQRTENHLKK